MPTANGMLGPVRCAATALNRQFATALKSLAIAAAMAMLPTGCAGDASATAPAATQAAAATRPADDLRDPQPMNFATTKMTLKGKQFTVEVADTDPKTEHGLMFRKTMEDNHGMLFIFDRPQLLEFYMKNTRIPLDIVFLDASGRVVDIEARRPMDEDAYGPKTPTQYVIELNQGTAEKIGLVRGDQVDLPKEYLKGGPGSSDK